MQDSIKIPENTQFYHDKENGVTYAVNVSFTKEDLLELVHRFDEPVGLMMGESYVHPNDNYCKKTGRELSSQRLKAVGLTLAHISNDEHKTYLNFHNKTTGLCVKFRLNKYSEKPHLIYVENYKNSNTYTNLY